MATCTCGSPDTGQLKTSLTGHTAAILSTAFSPVDHNVLASGSADGTARLWDPLTWKVKATLGHESPVWSITFRPDGSMLASGAEDGKVRQWELTSIALCCDRDPANDFNTLDAAGNSSPTNIWSDGTTMWVADGFNGKLYAYDMSARTRDAAKDFYSLRGNGNTRPAGIWSDGKTMWIADGFDEKLYAYDMSARTRDAAKDFYSLRGNGNTRPVGIWSDGTTM